MPTTDWISRLPRLPLLPAPTPVHRLEHFGAGELWIKREDRASVFGGGTKVRKLEFLLGGALASDKRRLVAIGAAGSHFLLSTAVFARQLGLSCEAYVCRQHMSEAAQRSLLTLHALDVRLIGGGSEVWTGCRFAARFARRRDDECFLTAGGSSALGTVGVVRAMFELKAQIEAGELPLPAMIVCALGSAGTLAGLTLGAQLADLETTVVGVRTYPARIGPIPAATAGTVWRLMRRTCTLLRRSDGCALPRWLRPPRVVEGWLGGGYAVPTAAGEAARCRLAECEGIDLDSTYTAKTFAGVLDLRCKLPGSQPILYWHTYGEMDSAHRPALPSYRELPPSFHALFSPPARRSTYFHGIRAGNSCFPPSTSRDPGQ